MASFSINLVNNGSGLFTPAVLRNPTAASGGTTVTIPWLENTLNGANTSTKQIGSALWQAFNAFFDVYSSTPSTNNQSFYITITDDGSQNFSAAVRYGGTAATGGTALTIPWITNLLNGVITSTDVLAPLLRVTTDAIVNSHSVTGV